jgi:hypothetical protein
LAPEGVARCRKVASWQHKTTTFCTELTSHSPPPTPLLPALTPSAGELKVSRTGGGLPPHSTRSSLEAQNGRPHFLAAFSRLLSRRHGGATGVLFRAPRSPAAAHQTRRLNWDCWLRLFGLRRTLPLQPPSTLLHHLRRTATVMARKKATPDELEARAEANGYQRGAHREEDSGMTRSSQLRQSNCTHSQLRLSSRAGLRRRLLGRFC